MTTAALAGMTAIAEQQAVRAARDPASGPSRVTTLAAWYGVFWLTVSNVIGTGLAVLLLWPSLGRFSGSWSYGRWMPVHMNLELYGWVSLPLIAWLMKIYRADREPFVRWSWIALLLWSMALVTGSFSWLSGNSSGKLFLDWSGYSRVLFPLAILFLWGVLAAAFARSRGAAGRPSPVVRSARIAGLLILLAVPFLIFAAASPNIYPAVNPDSGGPTGASQLESSLIVVLILLLLPYGVARRRVQTGRRWIVTAWVTFALEVLLCFGLGRGDVSHHRPMQYISLGSLLVWVPLIPACYNAFAWRPEARRWLTATFVWWGVLVVSGWSLFLPGILDRLKFTDGMVGHSLLAMAGFVSTLLILVMVQLPAGGPGAFASRWTFLAWQTGAAVYIAVMFVAGWIEGANPAFTMVPNTTRNVIYGIRLLCGLAMTAASAEWLWRLSQNLRSELASPPHLQESAGSPVYALR